MVDIGSIVPVVLGAVIALAASVTTTILTARSTLRAERVKIHEQKRHVAYRSLFKFARRLRNRIFPLAEDKRGELLEAMRALSSDLDYSYYSERIAGILDRLEEVYVCETHRDLASEELISSEFYDQQLPRLVVELDRIVREEMRVQL